MAGSAKNRPAPSAPPRPGRSDHAFRRFVFASGALGLVVAAMALPVIGTGALAARNAALSFENRPSFLDAPPPPARSTLLATDGTVIGEIAYENRVQVPLTQISK